ncbi:hypothetical protein [Streptomyces sp. NPDC059142]|uniref:hypothetical protein n=1 Tax=Streptomyces sp. NPDC059142 TaxID=3346739 RepID=UPI0036AE27DB
MGDPGADQDGGGTAEERELRVLLERVAPRPAGPEDRLARVRERVVRGRRRRRSAGAAAVAVAGLALAGALLPGVVRGGPERVLPAATVPGPVTGVPGPDATAAPSPSTARDRSGETPVPDGARVGFAHLGGLTLRPPSGWYALDPSPGDGPGAAAGGFVSSRPFVPYDGSCPAGRSGDCPPLRTLGPDGALVTLAGQGADLPPGTVGARSELHRSEQVSGGCRRIGGTREYSALVGRTPDASDSPTPAPDGERTAPPESPDPVPTGPVAAVSLCVAGDAPGTVEAVHTMITGADFDGGTALPSPPPAFPRDTK